LPYLFKMQPHKVSRKAPLLRNKRLLHTDYAAIEILLNNNVIRCEIQFIISGLHLK
jgi:hypothetical protein